MYLHPMYSGTLAIAKFILNSTAIDCNGIGTNESLVADYSERRAY